MTAGSVDKGSNIAEATHNAFGAIVTGAETTIGEAYGDSTVAEKLNGLSSPLTGNKHPLLILTPNLATNKWKIYPY